MAAVKKVSIGKLGTSGKVAFGFVMMLLPAVGYYAVFHTEVQSQIARAENQNKKLHGDLETAKKAEHAYQKDLEELRERERTKRELAKILPVSTEYPAFLSSIQNVSNLVGVRLHAWTPQAEVPEEFYARVPMRLELSGRFHQIAKFLYNVGQLERIINMENISITNPTIEDSETKLKVKVLATAFHAVEDVVKGGGPESRKRRGGKK